MLREYDLDLQVAWWKDLLDWGREGTEQPVIDATLEWLDANRPQDPGRDVVLWGDARISNVVWAEDGTPRAVLDWEVAGTGPRHPAAGPGHGPAPHDEFPFDRKTAVGPIRVEVVDPMRHLKVTVDAPEQGLHAELDYHARSAAVLEPNQTMMDRTRVIMDTCRYSHFGRWEGADEVGDRDPWHAEDTLHPGRHVDVDLTWEPGSRRARRAGVTVEHLDDRGTETLELTSLARSSSTPTWTRGT